MIKALKIFIGILVIPIAIAVSISLWRQLGHMDASDSFGRLFFLGGGSYILLHLLFYKKDSDNFVLRLWNAIYIFCHELMHAIAALLAGGRIKAFRASFRGGSIITTESNFLVALSPYIFPLYTILISLLFCVVSLFYKGIASYKGAFVFATGMTLAYHIILNMEFLKIEQPDIINTGYLFSIMLIYTANIVILSLILGFVFKDMSFAKFSTTSFTIAKDIYLAGYKQFFAPR